MSEQKDPLVGIVTTFRFAAHDEETVERCWSVVESFLLYHLAIGFDHIFLYSDADDGTDACYIERIEAGFSESEVTVTARSQSQACVRSRCDLWDDLGPFYDTEVQGRQSLNAELAMGMAAERGLRWLLHIDIDEASVVPHFRWLDTLGVEHMTYANHEGVPEREDIGDFFTEVTLFRRHHLSLPLSGPVHASMQWWCRRTGHGQYMLVYDNGKSAVRVLPGQVFPKNVHRWGRGQRPAPAAAEATAAAAGGKTAARGEDSPPPLVSRTALADPRDLRLEQFLSCPEPCILHYVTCGLDWLLDKYCLLGRFPSAWFGGRLPIAPSFHLDARDAVWGGQPPPPPPPPPPELATAGAENPLSAEGSCPSEQHGGGAWEGAALEGGAGGNCSAPLGGAGDASGPAQAARRLFREQVLLSPERDAAELGKQTELGVLWRLTTVPEVIRTAGEKRGRGRARRLGGAGGSHGGPAAEGARSQARCGLPESSRHGGSAAATAMVATGGRVQDAAEDSAATEVCEGGLGIPSAKSSPADAPGTELQVTSCGGEEGGGEAGRAAPTTVPAAARVEACTTAAAAGYERAWMLSSIAREYL